MLGPFDDSCYNCGATHDAEKQIKALEKQLRIARYFLEKAENGLLSEAIERWPSGYAQAKGKPAHEVTRNASHRDST